MAFYVHLREQFDLCYAQLKRNYILTTLDPFALKLLKTNSNLFYRNDSFNEEDEKMKREDKLKLDTNIHGSSTYF